MPFAKDFLWGAASASFQVEGGWADNGKAPSIWDALSEGHVRHGETGRVACDHYHRYKEDVALMKELGLKSYRFSVSWPRVMPREGQVNPRGLAFYKDLVKELTEAGIEPICTLYHWDMPLWVYEKGGWQYEGIADLFGDYAAAVVEAISDKVQYWCTLNEPSVFVSCGYIQGNHAPFVRTADEPEKVMDLVGPISRGILLSHGRAVDVIRAKAQRPPKIGIALAADIFTPVDDFTPEEAKRKTFTVGENLVFSAPYWMDPMLKGTAREVLRPYLSEADLKAIHRPLDFFGYNCYNSASYWDGPHRYAGMPITTMDWPITPDVLYWGSKFYYEEYGLPVLITENGLANNDFVMSDGCVHDPQRMEYIRWYLQGLKKAAEEGVPVLGYTYWSFMDNMEWADGYDKRFGLVYNDFRTQQRTVKDSARFYARIIATNGQEL